MKRGDYISLADLTADEIRALLARAAELKAHRRRTSELAGQSLALVFEKPSLRTRTSFDVAMYELGGHPVYLSPDEVGLGKRESVADAARVLSQYVHGIVARTFRHRDVQVLAELATVPVINALSDEEHPCQGLADLLTIQQCLGRLAGVRVAYVGDGNNVANTLVIAAARVGLHLTLASPPGYACRPALVAWAQGECDRRGGSVTLTEDPHAAVAGADVIYTDVWASMGQEHEADRRRSVFAPYRVDAALLRRAPQAIVMHDLPAHRGEEITDEVMDGPRSVVFQQAGNRLHAQKALLVWLLAPAI